MSQLTPADRITHLADLYHRAEMSNGSSVPSNWVLASTGSNKGITWTPQAAGGGASVSYGSNAMDVNPTDNGGASTDVSRMDHRHRGVRLLSSSGSNSLVGDINFVGLGSAGVTVSGQTIQISAVDTGGGAGTSASTILQAVYGSGVDGDVTISAPTTLNRDMFYNNLTVNDVLTVAGYRIFVKGTLSGTGTIRSNGGTGGNGGNGTGAAGGGAGGAGSSTSANNLGRGSAAVAGRVGGFNGAGLNGNGGQTPTVFRQDGSSINYSAGANGGAGTNAGGTGASSITGTNTYDPKPFAYPAAVEWRDYGTATTPNMDSVTGRPPGSGSGGGTAAGGGGGSGGSGAGGGPIAVVGKTWSGTFVVESKGGAGGTGGNGFASSGNNGGGGGGMGGPGGVIIAVYADRAGWSGSLDVSGGGGGNGGSGAGGGASGQNGPSGPAGFKLEFQMG